MHKLFFTKDGISQIMKEDLNVSFIALTFFRKNFRDGANNNNKIENIFTYNN